jgi:uncharacterized protein (DUF849 family)
VLIKAAINGARMKAEHTAIPVSPDEQAAAALECLRAGADAVHLHVRSTAGISFDAENETDNLAKESLYAEDVARTLLAVLAVCSKSQIGISTGAWILPDTAERLQAVAAWEVVPGFASVNFSEDRAVELAQLLLSKGVEVEAGLCDANAAEVFHRSGLVDRCLRVLLEPQEQEMAAALQTVSEIESALDTAKEDIPQRVPHALPRVLHGTEATAWPMLKEAIKRGYGVRIGFEDTLVLPDGSIARNNIELVTEAVRLISEK